MRAEFFLVMMHMVAPIAARAGDVVVVRKGAPVPVSVARKVGQRWRVVRQLRSAPDGIQAACDNGQLAPMPDALVG